MFHDECIVKISLPVVFDWKSISTLNCIAFYRDCPGRIKKVELHSPVQAGILERGIYEFAKACTARFPLLFLPERHPIESE